MRPNKSPVRFIPAPAGNSWSRKERPAEFPVHPRACGELAARWPRIVDGTGSSPRLRGTPGTLSGRFFTNRFIPAPAGNSAIRRRSAPPTPVHPRACGELCPPSLFLSITCGSSPRLRGTLQGGRDRRGGHRFIPAPAGNSRPSAGTRPASSVHPRACGELSTSSPAWTRAYGSSPRLRGTLPSLRLRHPIDRFIPAPAGNSLVSCPINK